MYKKILHIFIYDFFSFSLHGHVGRALFSVGRAAFQGRLVVLSTGRGPGHKAIETQQFLSENCPDFIKVDTHWRCADGEWPPSSPDLNLLDYVVWSILEEKACAKPHTTVESLKRALIKAWDKISVDTLKKIIDDLQSD
uniref:DDE-1 domain-containing protein n=1 Tax=Acrobeloides nanus TaxID=290746 RepID=A0A914CKA3_9BILA